jgi:hypothetical protein
MKYAELYNHWTAFNDQIRRWAEEDRILPDFPKMENGYDSKIFNPYNAAYNLALVNTVKKHISSTHTWIEGIDRWSHKYNNWFQSPFECKVCMMGAGSFHELGPHRLDYVKVVLENGDIPSQGMHSGFLYRTCEGVLKAKKLRGKYCMQCSTYGCIQNERIDFDD